MKLSVLLFILMSSTLLLCPNRSHAQLPLYDEAGRSYHLGRWQFDVQETYYQATANYKSSGGEYNNLPSGYSYTLLDTDFGVRWVPKERWALYLSSRVSNAESNNNLSTRRNSSLTQATIGTDFLFYSSKRFDLYPDISLTIPFQRVETTGDEVLNSEGTMEASGKIVGRMNWGRFDPFAFIGFTYRDDDRSSLLPYGAGAELQFSSWRLGGEVRGYQSVTDDKYTKNPSQREIVSQRNGNALRYYAVNPSLLETNFWLRGNLTQKWAMKFGGGTSITGASTSAGWTLFLGLSFSPEFKSSPSTPIVTPYQQEIPTEDPKKFQEETSDGVDQNLFRKPEPPPPVPPPAPKPNTDLQKKSMQNELDQTTFQIELKTIKKKKKRKH
jgi:hypothetical protein